MKITIGELLRQKRLEAGLTQAQAYYAIYGFGKLSGIISMYESGQREMSLNRFMELCALYGCVSSEVLREYELLCD